LIVDTDIIIWYMRGNEKARLFIDGLDGFRLSVVSYIELVQGLRDKTELRELRKALNDWQVNVLLIDEAISAKAMFYIEKFHLSHSLTLADALIAATAVNHGMPLHTGNDKHYRMISGLEVKKFKAS
jgi:predicted nucleic acid-binding protein